MSSPRREPVVLAIDAGTTGVRTRAVARRGSTVIAAYREFTQHFPRPGWVEHDADEIWAAVAATLREVTSALEGRSIAAIGITNQRETVVAWDRRTGVPFGKAIVWQDRRTAEHCDALLASGVLDRVRSTTGLVLDPYFSASKVAWMLTEGAVPTRDLAIGTIDSWLVWRLTDGAVHVTDTTNASRTMLLDIATTTWSAEMCDLFGVPADALAAVSPSSGRVGTVGIDAATRTGLPSGTPISGIAGDQQAALFGQACHRPGMAKNTYGTGSFVLLNVGAACPAPAEGMLSTIAWTLADGSTTYAYEGAVFATGAAVQWLRDGLGVIASAAEVGPLAESVTDSAGVRVVPAFTGLGSPWWDPYARGTIVGITRGTTRAHLARAVVDAMALQTADVVTAMTTAAGVSITDLRVDGGASVMDAMLQFQADLLGVTVRRPRDQETTALGAAYLAGLAEGVWTSLDDLADEWQVDAVFSPAAERTAATAALVDWHRAVERSRGWVVP
ncbi:MAG: glycerol kinase GlpK [Ilumatobacteraceae bacterium]